MMYAGRFITGLGAGGATVVVVSLLARDITDFPPLGTDMLQPLVCTLHRTTHLIATHKVSLS